MASCVVNISTKNYQNLTTGFQVTVENVRDVFFRYSVVCLAECLFTPHLCWYSLCYPQTDGQAEWIRMAGYILRRFTFTHPPTVTASPT